MKTIQVLSVAVLLFRLVVSGEVSWRSQYKRTLYSNGGLQSGSIANAEPGAETQSGELSAANAGQSVETQSGDLSTAKANVTMVAGSSTAETAPEKAPPMEPMSMEPMSMTGVENPGLTGEAVASAAAEVPVAAIPAAAASAALPLVLPPGLPPGIPANIPPEVLAKLIAKYLNRLAVKTLYAFFAFSILFFTLYRLGKDLAQYMRTISSLNNPKQEYYAEPSETFAKLQKNVIQAPMFKHRRALEKKALPTRIQAIYLVVYLLVNILLSVAFIGWGLPFAVAASQLRNRVGNLALANMVALVYIAGRQNAFINLTHLPFDTFNTMHRWFARTVVLLIVVHASAWSASVYSRAGFQGIITVEKRVGLITFGSIAFSIFIIILIQASSPIRHAFYESFKTLHKILVAASLAAIYIHLYDKPNAQFTVKLIIFLWANDYLLILFSLVKNNIGKKSSRATVEALPGDAVKVTLELAHPWKFIPGQHIYLYMPSVGFLQSHPFSVAWASSNIEDIYPEKLIENKLDIKSVTSTKFELIIKQRGGFTKKLVQKAQKAPDGKFTAFAMAEGPYGGLDKFTSYGTVMLVAGGVGITHIVPYIQQLVTCHSKSTTPTRRITLVWVIPRPELLNWIAPWMQEILQIGGRRDCLRLLIYITKLGDGEDMESPSTTIQIIPGRPDIGALMDWETEPVNQVGAMGVGVCGGGALADDVRKAVRERQMRSNIDFVEESFSW